MTQIDIQATDIGTTGPVVIVTRNYDVITDRMGSCLLRLVPVGGGSTVV